MNESNKGYKFKFEIEDIIKGESEENSDTKYRFTAYGDTAEETVQNYEQLVKVWYKKVDKSEKRPFDDKKALK